jgi:hypothetical protein
MDRVLHDGVRATVRIERGDAVTAVRGDDVVEHERARVAGRDRDAAAALAAGRAVAHDAVALDANRHVLAAPSEQRDARASCAGDGQPADRHEARLLELDRVPLRALRDRAVQHDAARRHRRVRLHDDAARLGPGTRVLADDAHPLDVGAGPHLHGVAGLRRVHRGLDAPVARGPPAARGVRSIDVADGGAVDGRGSRRGQRHRHRDGKEANQARQRAHARAWSSARATRGGRASREHCRAVERPGPESELVPSQATVQVGSRAAALGRHRGSAGLCPPYRLPYSRVHSAREEAP